MRRCFELALKGLGLTQTNPLVGCVIVHGDTIIGEGYHHEFGGPHAEVIAIRSVADHSLLPESTLYVNLEPCVHYGKTPPCSTLVLQKGIRKVVISNKDPFPSVNGRGVAQLQQAGVEVRTGVLVEEGYRLNRRFFGYHLRKRPYVILKWARTIDGFIDLVRGPDDPIGTNWITDDVSRTLVHKWRAEETGVMVGTNTIIADNPMLNIRRWGGNNPVRITADRYGRLPGHVHILDGTQETIVFTGVTGKYCGRTRCIRVDPSYQIGDFLEELYSEKILSILVEGGAGLLHSFLDSGIWDEARVFTGKLKFSQGIPAPRMEAKPDEIYHFRDTVLDIFRNHAHAFH
ncbi:MAG: bifunctional diaminohydroxyphosphoribosylaminopyrimidine deaminase/5-amino-6-(5-phosphoribosylamino)uracil reductase RibD [Bacteroidetes bacterium]|nr:MAG: bifunctional diaminohydroxyphosphoribosylaminopyrimidine deaminase/5-amino-6-(5-phosphoribosylamino)uracil reductase RibD [Bacteroidota bacterium]